MSCPKFFASSDQWLVLIWYLPTSAGFTAPRSTFPFSSNWRSLDSQNAMRWKIGGSSGVGIFCFGRGDFGADMNCSEIAGCDVLGWVIVSILLDASCGDIAVATNKANFKYVSIIDSHRMMRNKTNRYIFYKIEPTDIVHLYIRQTSTSNADRVFS